MKNKKRITAHLMQDIGLLGFLVGIFSIVISIYYAEGYEKTEYLIMFLGLFVPILFCMYKMTLLSYAFTGVQLLSYAIYKLYQWSVWKEPFTLSAYVWLFIPILTIGSLSLFVRSLIKIELINEILREQVEELVLVDPLTGLYNLRSLYNDLNRQIGYAKRHNLEITLMEVKLKYEQELRNILSSKQFDRLRQTMAEVVEDSLRIEDKLYAIDRNGTMAILLTCGKEGAEVVERRLREVFSDREMFKEVIENTIKVEVKIGYVEYQQEKISNAMEFLRQTENELQYDV